MGGTHIFKKNWWPFLVICSFSTQSRNTHRHTANTAHSP
jgi:hypothetical protein